MGAPLLPCRRERDWSLSHRRPGQSRCRWCFRLLPFATVSESETVDRLGWAAASRRPKPQPKISTSASSLARLKSRRRVKLGCRPPNCTNSIRQNLFQARQSTIECRACSSGAPFSLHVAGRAPRLVQLLSRAPAMN